MQKINLLIVAVLIAFGTSAQTTSTFESLTLGVDTFWNGSSLTGGFSNGNAYFENIYDTSFGGYWQGGFVYSDKTDITTAGYTNPASAITGSGFGGSAKYAVAQDDGFGNVKVRTTGNAAGKIVQGVYVTNTTYAYLSMKNGDNFEHAFKHDSLDYFLLHITGWKNGSPVANTVNFYLANFITDSVIVNTWQYVGLSSLGDVDSLRFWLTGSQNSTFGLLTPAYFAIDNFVTANIGYIQDTLKYDQDTLINVLAGYPDTSGGPFTVNIIGNDIPGASIAVDSANLIFYVPQQGVVGWDTITYTICNASNQCDTGQVVINVQSPTGITEVNALQTKVYPNPFTTAFTVYHTGEVKFIYVYDMDGRLVREISCNSNEMITGIQADSLQAGVYIVKVISDKAVGVTKITRQ